LWQQAISRDKKSNLMVVKNHWRSSLPNATFKRKRKKKLEKSTTNSSQVVVCFGLLVGFVGNVQSLCFFHLGDIL
jgi:hypothetical protein